VSNKLTKTLFKKNGYVEIPNTLDFKKCNKLTNHLFKLKNSNNLKTDRQCPDSLSIYNDKKLDKLLSFYAPLVSKISGKELLPTYCYARLYQKGTKLKKHKDRKACEISVTLTLGYSGTKSWPIKFMSLQDKEVSLDMNIGSLCIYKGCELEHWRDPLKDEWQTQVFLHYVDKNGEYKEEAVKERNRIKKVWKQRQGTNKEKKMIKVEEDPLITVYDNFLSVKETEHILNQANNLTLNKAKVCSNKDNKSVYSSGRTGLNGWLPHSMTSFMFDIGCKIADIVNQPLNYAEKFQVVEYGTNQKYDPHYDAWNLTTEQGKKYTKNYGQRTTTCLIYLNTVEKGGSTLFPNLNVEIKAKQGRMVVFNNLNKEKERHVNSLHGGMLVEKGNKYITNLWFREKPLYVFKERRVI